MPFFLYLLLLLFYHQHYYYKHDLRIFTNHYDYLTSSYLSFDIEVCTINSHNNIGDDRNNNHDTNKKKPNKYGMKTTKHYLNIATYLRTINRKFRNDKVINSPFPLKYYHSYKR